MFFTREKNLYELDGAVDSRGLCVTVRRYVVLAVARPNLMGWPTKFLGSLGRIGNKSVGNEQCSKWSKQMGYVVKHAFRVVFKTEF